VRRRILVACLFPAFAVSAAWLQIEEPRRAGEALVVAALALLPALVTGAWRRAGALAAAALGATWLAFGAQPWELLPYRDERVLEPLASTVRLGLGDFYAVLLPFDAQRNPEMHALTLVAIFGFVAAVGLLVAGGRPVGAAAVTVAGAGWPATLLDGRSVALGALALAAALSIPLVLRVRTTPAFAAGAAIAVGVVGTAIWASSATTLAREAALDWQAWNLGRAPVQATSVRYVWDANYDGIDFPSKRTVVLVVDGPDRARYWRASTLDHFTADRWVEGLTWLGRVGRDVRQLPLDRLTPARARDDDTLLEQRIEVRALVDDRLVSAGTPVAIDSRRLGPVYVYAGGVLRLGEPLERGTTYRVWSHDPDPSPAALAGSKARYGEEAETYLVVDGRRFPSFGAPGRDAVVRGLLRDPSYGLAAYEPLYDVAGRVARQAGSPYEAVLALESWFRLQGGFAYEEHPPKGLAHPLVEFVTRTRAGYCQHFAGAMAVMLRLLGIPARVAVGFTSGTREDGKWLVGDRDAHAWVEVWFPGEGWVAFDPTPGRGTFGGRYSFASDSPDAVAALRRGDLSERPIDADRLARGAEVATGGEDRGRDAPSLIALALGLTALWVALVGGGKALRRRAAYLTRDPRRLATASRRELEGFLRDQGLALEPSASLEDLRRALRTELGVDARPFTNAVARARFGRPGRSRDAHVPRRELRGLKRTIRLQLSGWARFRGLVSLRSLQGSGPR
jgi:transglutaminase-like putative cysteine protease